MNTTRHSISVLGRRQRGFTLMEIMVGIAIMAIGMAALAWGINKAFAGNDVKDEAKAITRLVSVLPEQRTASGYGTNTLVPGLVAQNEIPSVWTIGGTASAPSIRNSWGGSVTVMGNYSNVLIGSYGVPKDACNKLVMRLSRGGNFKSVAVNAGTPLTGEVSASAAAAACSRDLNTAVWATVN